MAILQPLKSSGRSNNEEIPIAFIDIAYTNKLLLQMEIP